MKKILLVMMLLSSCQPKGDNMSTTNGDSLLVPNAADTVISHKPINILDTTNICESYSLLVRNRDTVYIHDTIYTK